MAASEVQTVALPAERRTRALPSWRAAAAATSLALLVAGVTLVVLVAAARWTFLVPPGKTAFPHWMAGPLQGFFTAFDPTRSQLKVAFTATLGGLYLVYLLALLTVPALRARWLIAAVVGVHVALVLSPPLSLTDVFNYIGYGRMGALHGLNPYTHIPQQSPHSDPSFALSNWHHLRSPYGPLFTLLTYALVPLGVPGAFWAWKIVLMAASLGLVAVVWRCAQALGKDPRLPVAIVALNPLVLVWGIGGDHNDALMVLALTAALLAMLTGREALGGAATAVAVGLKASAAVVVPVLLLGAPRRRRAVAGALAGGAAVAAASLAAFGPHLPNVADQSRFVAGVSVPNLLGLALGYGGESDALRNVLAAVLAAIVVVSALQAWRGRDLPTAAGVPALASLLVLSWVLPWYIWLLLPFAALSRSRALRGATLVMGVWLILSWMPLLRDLVHGIGFYPTRTPLGRVHNRITHRALR